jgi:hypothetical protein
MDAMDAEERIFNLTPRENAIFNLAALLTRGALALTSPGFVAGLVIGEIIRRDPELGTLHTPDVLGAYLEKASRTQPPRRHRAESTP